MSCTLPINSIEVCVSYNVPALYLTLGDYVVVEPIIEGNKVQAEITHILFPKQIKYLKERKNWSVWGLIQFV